MVFGAPILAVATRALSGLGQPQPLALGEDRAVFLALRRHEAGAALALGLVQRLVGAPQRLVDGLAGARLHEAEAQPQAWQPLRRRGLGLAQMMIVTIGLSLTLQYVFQFFIGASTVKVLVFNPTPRSLGPISYTSPDLIAMGVSVVVIALVVYERVLGGAGGFAGIDESRSKAIFAGLEQQLAAMLPDDAPQWIAAQYERLTANCR